MLNAGVLGAGHLGKIHLRLLNQSEKYNLVGFYDSDEENGKRVEAEFGYKFFRCRYLITSKFKNIIMELH